MTQTVVTTTHTVTASDAEAERGDEATRLTSMLFLVLEAGRPRASGARFSLSSTDEVTIGRAASRSFRRTQSASSTLELSLPSRTLSSAHARLRNHRGHWSLQDLGSTNGTLVNGVRVSDAVLRDGDLIELGQCFFVFREGLPTPRAMDADVELSGPSGGECPRTLLPLAADQLRLLTALAPTKLPILLRGETGTGKELLARAVHRESGRRGPFVAVNCGALNPSLLDAQLFGHCRGSFSGATRDEPGLVRAAHGGTLLLDEVGDMPPAAQVALLRVLQEQEVLPVGTAKPCPVDVRVVAATHRPLEQLVMRGEFRADLLGRLNGHVHTLPALRKRREDLGLLLADVLRDIDAEERVQRLSPEAARWLLTFSWPLNVRQLAQSLSRALALVTDGVLRVSELAGPQLERSEQEPAATEAPPVLKLNADEEQLRSRLVDLLSAEHGNVTNVARRLGKARMQVQRWMKRFGVDPAAYRH